MKIRALLDERGQPLEIVKPGEPCEIMGANAVPESGDRFYVVESEREAREIASKRRNLQRQQRLVGPKQVIDLDNLAELMTTGDLKELPIIIKGDVAGSVEALADQLMKGGLDIVTGGTDTHLMLVDLRPKGVKGNATEKALGRAHITCNKNGIPFDSEKPTVTSGIRLGSPAALLDLPQNGRLAVLEHQSDDAARLDGVAALEEGVELRRSERVEAHGLFALAEADARRQLADALGQAATQAPHPIQAAASIAFSAIS